MSKYKLVLKDSNDDLYTDEEKYLNYLHTKVEPFKKEFIASKTKKEASRILKRYIKFINSEVDKVADAQMKKGIKGARKYWTAFDSLNDWAHTLNYGTAEWIDEDFEDYSLEEVKSIILGTHPDFDDMDTFDIYPTVDYYSYDNINKRYAEEQEKKSKKEEE